MTGHLYSAAYQPAHNFMNAAVGPRRVRPRIRCNPRRLKRCISCSRLRWAKYLAVQVYYDGLRHYCREGRGCRRKR